MIFQTTRYASVLIRTFVLSCLVVISSSLATRSTLPSRSGPAIHNSFSWKEHKINDVIKQNNNCCNKIVCTKTTLCAIKRTSDYTVGRQTSRRVVSGVRNTALVGESIHLLQGLQRKSKDNNKKRRQIGMGNAKSRFRTLLLGSYSGVYLSGLDDEDAVEEVISKSEEKALDKNYEVAVQEVQEAVQEAQESANKLKETLFEKGPNILGKMWRSCGSRELRDDIRRRKVHYKSDWVDGNQKRTIIPACLFLYFACLAPVVSFGTIASQITEGSIGIVEFFISSGLSGIAYAIFSGQPMAFIAPTGLSLAFLSGLFKYCTLQGFAFLPVYTWVGLWTSLFMILLGFGGASKLIRYCTHFTDEIFNGLLSLNFIYEAWASIHRNFALADPINLTMPFVSLGIAFATFKATMGTVAFRSSKYFNEIFRTIIKDFGPVAVIILMSFVNQIPWIKKFGVPTLSVPSTLQLAGGRNLIVPFLSVPLSLRLKCMLPALLLTTLIFMDQNISVRVVNNPKNHLKKGEAYNIDMVVLGVITGFLSIAGLPWMCGATVQSMNHVRAMTKMVYNKVTNELEVDSVNETRVTGLVIHAMILGTLSLLQYLRILPIPVVSGVFFFLGRKLMTGNTFLARIRDSVAESSRMPKDHPMNVIGRFKMNLFTFTQFACLMALWTFKQWSATAIFFPSAIGMLMVVRSFLLPNFFEEREFVALGDPTPRRNRLV